MIFCSKMNETKNKLILYRTWRVFLYCLTVSYRRVKSLFWSIIPWFGVVLKFTLISWAFEQSYCWRLQNLKMGPKIIENVKITPLSRPTFCLKLGKGWKSQYALGRFCDFLLKMASISVYFSLKVKHKFPYHIGVVSTKINSRSAFFLQGGGGGSENFVGGHFCILFFKKSH